MRFVRHLLSGVLLLAVLLVGAAAFALYDPFSKSPRFLTLSQLVTASRLDPIAHSESDIQATDPPWLVALARRYQPLLVVSGYDRFWPMSLGSIMAARWHGHGACLYEHGNCHERNPTLLSLTGHSSRSDWLQLPSPPDSISATFDAVATQLGISARIVHGWPQTDPPRGSVRERADLLQLPAPDPPEFLPGAARGAGQPPVLVPLSAQLLPADPHPAARAEPPDLRDTR